MYQLQHPQYLYFLLLIPAVALLFAWFVWWQRRARRAFGDRALFRQMAPNVSKNKYGLKFTFALLIIAALSIALVNPQIGTRLETVKREGVDIVLLLDVSKSMEAQDVAPSRLARAKRLTHELLNNLANDRIGLIIYAADAYPLLPLTSDYGALHMLLQNVDTDMISSQGTGIGSALKLGQQYLEKSEGKNPVMILLSDGEDHEMSYSEEVASLRDKNIKLYTVGFGTDKGGPIPKKVNGRTRGYKTDNAGEVVITRINEKAMQKMAVNTQASYFYGDNSNKVINGLKKELQQLEKQEFESRMFADYQDQFPWFIGTALLLLFIDSLFLERKTRWLQKLKLFGDESK